MSNVEPFKGSLYADRLADLVLAREIKEMKKDAELGAAPKSLQGQVRATMSQVDINNAVFNKMMGNI